jgi:hypothetical protein
MERKLEIKKLTYLIFFSFLLYFLIPPIFLKTNFVYSQSSQQQCSSYRSIPYSQIPQALSQLASISRRGETATGSRVLNDYLTTGGSASFSEILNPLGGQVRNVKVITGPLQPDVPPPRHKKVSRTLKSFYILATTTVNEIDTDGDGTSDYTTKGSLLFLNEANILQELIYKSNTESTFQQKTDVLTEIYDVAECVPTSSESSFGGVLRRVSPDYRFFKIGVSTGTDTAATTTPYTNIIFNIKKPECREWETSGLLRITKHVECRMDALAFNGQFGEGYYYDKATQKSLLPFILAIFVGIFLAFFGFSVVTFVGIRTIGSILYFSGGLVAIGGAVATLFTTHSFVTIATILENATYGTTDRPAGGLEKFSWYCPYGGRLPSNLSSFRLSRFCPPFSGPSVSCSLTASPTSKDAPPLTVTFNLTGDGTLESWDGPCSLRNPPSSCSFTYNNPGTYGPYTVRLREGTSCSSPRITVGQGRLTNYDLAVTSFDIRTFICKNKNFDLSYLNEYLSRNSNYEFAPSTTYAHEFYNKVASSTCPESQRNRPVEFSATGVCLQGTCPASRLKIDIISNSPPSDQESTSSETAFDNRYPKSMEFTYIFNKPYDYKVKVCLVDQNGQPINDMNNSNNCKEQTIRIFDYMCLLGFCSQNQRDINNPSPVFSSEPLMYRIIETFGDTDSPCRFWRNEICRARYGF